VFDLRGDGDGAGTMTFEEWQSLDKDCSMTGGFKVHYENVGAQTSDSKRISDLEQAVAEIRAQIEIESNADITWIVSRTKSMESALKVIHTWASFPESFDCEQTKRLCMSALGREE
jgi:hypothetical protein